MILLLICYLAILFYAGWETYYDGKLIDVFKLDGQFTDDEDKLVHLQQMPGRAVVVLLASLATGTLYDQFILYSIIAFLAYAFMYWLVFDILINVWVLEENFDYIGSTSKIDRFMGKLFFSGKIYVGFKAAFMIFFSIVLLGSV